MPAAPTATTASFTAPRVSMGLLLAGALALVSAAAGMLLAAHHPLLLAATACALWLGLAALAAWAWTRTPLLLLGALPLIGLAPWSGWITFEELDLLALACAAGGYAALVVQRLRRFAPARVPAWRRMLSYSPLVLLLMALFGASLLLALQRGFADAGGFSFGWFQGYHEPMNSLRLTKSYFLVVLLLPLWLQAGMRRPRELGSALLWGMVLALVGTSLAALAERAAFTGLLNFSSDYRSTALFWEMHVGGAALDGCLALSLPFAVLALLSERRPWRFGLLMALCLLAAYAVLTTFSRGLYLALPLGMGVMVVLRDGQRRRALRLGGGLPAAQVPLTAQAKLGVLLLASAFVAAAVWVFEGGGYRGLLALLGAAAVLLAMPASVWLPSTGQRITGLLMAALAAVVLTAASYAASMALPKAAYVAYTLAFAAAVALRLKDKPGQAQPIHACLVTTTWFWLLGGMVVVADSWGGAAARDSAVWAAVALAALWALMWLRPALWPLGGRAPGAAGAGWRNRSLLFTLLVLVSAVIASLSGGEYLRGRAATWQGDMQGRVAHWKVGVALLETPQDWLFGKGAGRFVVNHFFAGPVTQHTGDYRLARDPNGKDDNRHLVLTGGKHMLGYGELFRVSQRIAAPDAGASGDVQLAVRARSASNTVLHTEICEKQLLYIENCMSANLMVTPQPGGQWQSATLSLGKARAMGGRWYAPRFVTFSLALETTGGMLDIAELKLSDGNGHPLLANGDFSREMAHWFFSSDRYHLPWHMKNLGLHVLFDQGLVGLLLLNALLLLALLRLSFGRGREHVLAPALAAGLVGFLVVGLFDSLIDAPRIAFMFYTLLLISLGLRALPGAAGAAGAEPSK